MLCGPDACACAAVGCGQHGGDDTRDLCGILRGSQPEQPWTFVWGRIRRAGEPKKMQSRVWNCNRKSFFLIIIVIIVVIVIVIVIVVVLVVLVVTVLPVSGILCVALNIVCCCLFFQ